MIVGPNGPMYEAAPDNVANVDGPNSYQFVMHASLDLVNEIEWSDDLSDQAQEWANNLAKKDKIYHSSSESRVNQGENLYYSFKSQNRKPVFSKSPAKDASLAWYNEINDYKYSAYGSKLNESVMIGHYTQMVWKSTTKVGIALARSSDGKEYIVARYSPPGNYLGKYPY